MEEKLVSNSSGQIAIDGHVVGNCSSEKNLSACKKAVSSLEMTGRFMFQKGRKASVVEYKDEVIDGWRVLTYRDLNEAAAEQTNYLRHMELGGKSYTQENFLKLKDFMGVIVLQTSLLEKTSQEIYELYKKRWTIETFYNYFKNKAGCIPKKTKRCG